MRYTHLLPEERPQLRFLDGMRGLLVFSVVAGHAIGYSGERGAVAEWSPPLGKLLLAAELRVPVFFVLSGYALMIAVSRDPQFRVRGGFRGHVRRRARRLLPPYFAALALSLGLIWAVPLLRAPAGTAWDSRIPVTPESVVTHLLLVHNVSPDTFFRINAPLWTMAVEWQLGLLLPLLVVVWRRTSGIAVLVALAALAAGSSVTGVLEWSAPVLAPLFGLGMVTASVVHRTGPVGPISHALLRRRRIGPLVAAAALALAVAVGIIGETNIGAVPTIAIRWFLAGVAAAVFLAVMTHRERTSCDSPASGVVRKVLTFQPLCLLGLVSYSVYLVHNPLLALGNLLFLRLGLSVPSLVVLQLLITVPSVVLIGALFAWVIERPCMNSHQRQAFGQMLGRRSVP